MKCGYAAPGTYGHECGRPAVIAAVKASDLMPGLDEFVSGRCGECRNAKGRDNWGVRFEPLEPGRDKPYWRKKGVN